MSITLSSQFTKKGVTNADGLLLGLLKLSFELSEVARRETLHDLDSEDDNESEKKREKS